MYLRWKVSRRQAGGDVPSDPWGTIFPLDESYLSPILLGFVAETLVFGMHVILFLFCLQVLLRRSAKKRRMQKLMVASICVMFILATVDVGVSWNIVLRHTKWMYTGDSTKFVHAIHPKFWLHLFNNFIADTLLIIRCYVVWNRNRILLGLAVVVHIVGTVFGFVSEATTSPSLKVFIAPYLLIVLTLNVAITLLTAGRIWWVAREAKRLVGREIQSQYKFAIVILVESGFIYTTAMILLFALSGTRYIILMAGIGIRVVCIMPTLIIAQIAMGQLAKDLPTTTTELQPRSQGVVLDTAFMSEEASHQMVEQNENEVQRSPRNREGSPLVTRTL